jgi:hypothetical protein
VADSASCAKQCAQSWAFVCSPLPWVRLRTSPSPQPERGSVASPAMPERSVVTWSGRPGASGSFTPSDTVGNRLFALGSSVSVWAGPPSKNTWITAS